MTTEIALVLAILLITVLLFATDRIRMDVVALLVLCALAVTGLVAPEQAIAGFSHPAVMTVWAMFVLSEGMARAGIAEAMERRLVKVLGRQEIFLVAGIMLLAGALSAFMNNIGVAALLLPVVVGVSHQVGLSPSRLLMPMVFACMLGGSVTLIGTPPNLLVSSALEEGGFDAFGLFDFLPVGLPLLLVGTAFVALLGRHLLPSRDPVAETGGSRDLRDMYSLQERVFAVEVADDSLLAGKRLGETGLTAAAGLMIVALNRNGQTHALPSSVTRLQAGDVLLAQGRLDRFKLLRQWSELTIEREAPVLHRRLLEDVALYELKLEQNSKLLGHSLGPAQFHKNTGGWLLAVRRGDSIRRTHLDEYPLREDDCLLIQANEKDLKSLMARYVLEDARLLDKEQVLQRYQLDERLLVLKVPQDAALVGKTIGDMRLGKAFDLRMLALFREGEFIRPLPADTEVQGGDFLLVQGRMEEFDQLRGLQQLRMLDDATPYMAVFEQGKVSMVEAILHPHKWISNKTVADLKLREAWQVEVAAVWRGGRPYRSGLKHMELQRGDALLLVAPVKHLARLNQNRDLIILNPVSAPKVDKGKAPWALGSMLLVVLASLSGWLPIYIASLLGATLMVLSRCLSMEQAYKAIHWRSIVLLAGMLPLGQAMQNSGAASYLSEHLLSMTASLHPWWSIAALYGLTVLGTLVIPTVVLTVLMAPIALSLSLNLGVAPQAAMMAVAIAAGVSVASPISHPANILVMGPGAYRFVDFLKLGLPLTLVVFLVAAILMPWVWPI